MVSWFQTVTEEEILAVYEAAVPNNTKKTAKFGLAIFTSTVSLLLAVRLSAKTEQSVYNCSLQRLRQSNSSLNV